MKTEILEYIKKHSPVKASEILKAVNISNTNLHINLLKLIDSDEIEKTGSVPIVYYSYKNKEANKENIKITEEQEFVLHKNYVYVEPSGKIIRGVAGFLSWCDKNKTNPEKELVQYIKDIDVLKKVKKDNIISAKNIILSKKLASGKNSSDAQEKVYLDKLYFSDFYSISHFGKTKLGQLVYVAKTSQNKELIKEIVDIIKPQILFIIEKFDIKNVGFIPPTVIRKTQFLKELEKYLKLEIPTLKISKIKSSNLVAQKTLKKLEDRIENASKTIAVSPSQKIENFVLLLDDATGSGATLNETARKIKNINEDCFVVGYSIVGSIKGFDVINEI